MDMLLVQTKYDYATDSGTRQSLTTAALRSWLLLLQPLVRLLILSNI